MNMDEKEAPGQGNYMAFISYRHADNHEDGRKWADWLHHFLETYEIPADLVGQTNHYGQPIPSQIYPVFQDEKELSVDADLSASIRKGLDRTRTLVVLCSPQSVKSRYVEEEIAYFKQLGRARNIIAVILYGRPGGKESGDPNEQECFPLPLRYDVNEQGALVREQLAAEHLAADVRTSEQTQGYTTPHAYRAMLEQQGKISRRQVQAMTTAYKERLELAKLKIIAGILGVSLADLTKRDKAYQLQKAQKRQKLIKRVAFGFAILFLVALASGIYAWLQQKETQRTFAQSLYNIGVERMEGKKEDEGAAYLAAATRLGNKDAFSYTYALLGNLHEKWISFPDTSKADEIVFNPDGKTLATLFLHRTGGGKVQIWDLSAMKLLREFSREKERLNNFTFSDNGRICYGLFSKGIAGWNVYSGKPAGPPIVWDSGATVIGFRLSPNAKYVLMDDLQGQCKVYNSQTGRPTGVAWQHPLGATEKDVFFNDEQLIASYVSNRDSAFQIRAAADTFAAPRQVLLHDKINLLKQGSAKEELVAVTDHSVFFVDGVKGEVTDTLNLRFVRDVRFNPDGRSLALETFSTTKVVDKTSHQVLRELRAPGFLPSSALNLAPDGIHQKRQSRLIELRDHAYRQVLLPPFFERTDFFALSPDGKRLYTLTDKEAAIKVWDAVYGTPIKADITSTDTLTFFTLSRNGAVLIGGARNGQVRFWDSNTGRPNGPVFRHEGRVLFAQDNQDHTLLFTVYNEKMARCWSVKDGKPLGKPLQFNDPIIRAQLCYNGRYAAVATSKGLLQLWDTEKMQNAGKPLNYTASRIVNCQFSPDNKMIAVALQNGLIEVIDIASSRVLLHFTVQADEGIVRFSPDSKRLITMANANELQVREISTGMQGGDAMSHTEPIRQVVFSPDNRLVLTVSGIGSRVRFWNPENGKPVSGYLDYSQYGRAGAARFSADGKKVMIPSIKGGKVLFLAVWEVPGLIPVPGQLLAEGVEALFGRKYNIDRGILEKLDQSRAWDSLAAANSRNWFFENGQTRPPTPASKVSQTDQLTPYTPLRNDNDVQVLEAGFPLHPLSRALLAEYYSRKRETGFWAEDLIKMVNLQLRSVKDPRLKEKTEKWLRKAADNLQQLKGNGI